MSDWKKKSIQRRDERHTHTPEPDRIPGRTKPNRKRWCRGKVDVPHKPVWRESCKYCAGHWMEFACTECGKKLDYWWVGRQGCGGMKPAVGSTIPLQRGV